VLSTYIFRRREGGVEEEEKEELYRVGVFLIPISQKRFNEVKYISQR